jgi:hypothetical protein
MNAERLTGNANESQSAFTAEFDPMFATGPNVESNLFKDLP